ARRSALARRSRLSDADPSGPHSPQLPLRTASTTAQFQQKKRAQVPLFLCRHGAGLMHRTGPETRGFRPPESWAPADLIAVAHIRIIPFEFPSGRSLRSPSRPTLTFHKTTEFLNLPRQLATAAIPLRDISARSPAGFWRKGTNRGTDCQADGPPAP